jgi:hypothetical protein
LRCFWVALGHLLSATGQQVRSTLGPSTPAHVQVDRVLAQLNSAGIEVISRNNLDLGYLHKQRKQHGLAPIDIFGTYRQPLFGKFSLIASCEPLSPQPILDVGAIPEGAAARLPYLARHWAALLWMALLECGPAAFLAIHVRSPAH